MYKFIIILLSIKSYYSLTKKCTFYFPKDSIYYDLKDTRRSKYFN